MTNTTTKTTLGKDEPTQDAKVGYTMVQRAIVDEDTHYYIPVGRKVFMVSFGPLGEELVEVNPGSLPEDIRDNLKIDSTLPKEVRFILAGKMFSREIAKEVASIFSWLRPFKRMYNKGTAVATFGCVTALERLVEGDEDFGVDG